MFGEVFHRSVVNIMGIIPQLRQSPPMPDCGDIRGPKGIKLMSKRH